MNTDIGILVEEIKEVDRKFQETKGMPYHLAIKKKASELRKKLANLMDSDYLFLNDMYLVRQHHNWGSTVAFFSKDSWAKREQYLEQKNLLKRMTKETF